MKRFLMLSRFAPSPEQVELARDQGVELIPGSDCDAFGDVLPSNVVNIRGRDYPLDGFVVMHPLIALKLLPRCLDIGVFQFEQDRTSMRNGIGKPALRAVGFHIVNVQSVGGQLVFALNGVEYGAIETG